jgi:hypothetical protein
MHDSNRWLQGVALATAVLAQQPPYKDSSQPFEKRVEDRGEAVNPKCNCFGTGKLRP